jgi:hypothetical protein
MEISYTCAPRTGHASLSGSLSQILISNAVYPGPRSSFMRVATVRNDSNGSSPVRHSCGRRSEFDRDW